MQPIGNNLKYFTCLVGNEVRFTVPPCYPSWTEGDWSSDEYRVVCAAVDHLVADRYRDYKLKAHNHLKLHGPSRSYDEIFAKDWQKCIDFFTSPTFVERSSKNKVNRGKATYPSVQGSKSFSATCYDEVASSGASLDERAIAKEVLGERRDHVHGVGRVPKDTSPSLDLTAASEAPQETSHQFSRDPQNNDPQFAMYETQLRQMQREIELLKNSIPVVVPKEDENGDEDEGLGDF
ncbi:Uncharacterized protein Adt_35643 [Abeliophyllum distichum]|uniref:Transposase n=1 Tax=Abeliophyllum distichum TaxID=126358 RepID=A0ABD1QGN2_9LAMI